MDITKRQPLTVDEFRRKLLMTQGPVAPDRFSIVKAGPAAGSIVSGIIFNEPAIDETNMTVRMRISTAQIDRVRDIVVQEGIKKTFYVDNPQVLYGHGMEGIHFGVAMSDTVDGECTVTTQEDGTYAIARHSPKIKLSSQIFDMVVEKLIRASSVGIDPLVLSYGYDHTGEEIQFIDECELNEWSYCMLGCNPGALVKSFNAKLFEENLALQCEAANRILNKRKLDGTSLHPVLMKSMQAMLVTKSTGIGFDPEPKVETKTMKSLTSDQIKKLTRKQLAKEMGELEKYDEPTQMALKEAVDAMPEEDTPAPAPVVADEVAKAEVNDFEVEDEASDDTPLGAKVVRGIHEGLKTVIATAEAALAPVENPEVKAKAQEAIDNMRAIATELEGLFTNSYKELPALGGEEVEASDEMVKSFLALNPRGRDQVRGLSARISAIADAAAKGKPVSVKTLRQTASDLSRLDASIKSFKAPESNEAKYKAALDKAYKAFNDLVAKLEQTPANAS
jgi:hypothetical protein